MIRLIVDPPRSGSLNMAIDQALLQSAAERDVATFRIYRWEPATVSLGYFQNFDSREGHEPSQNCPLVRRASGGGAIVHDHEMTYSIALPASNEWSSRNRDLFDAVHQSLIECLEELGVPGCTVYSRQEKESREAPFLCFLRRAVGDVILRENKIIGSAQRRLSNALLQHGSVLVSQSACAPELPGIQQLVPESRCDLATLIQLWPTMLAKRMNWTLESADLSTQEMEAAQSIESIQFDNDSWNRKR